MRYPRVPDPPRSAGGPWFLKKAPAMDGAFAHCTPLSGAGDQAQVGNAFAHATGRPLGTDGRSASYCAVSRVKLPDVTASKTPPR